MKDLSDNPYGKFNGKEQEYVLQALYSSLVKTKSFNLRFEEQLTIDSDQVYDIDNQEDFDLAERNLKTAK
tara:strand:+ start:781 stop:990 length:210 start_codon:yes stop_codon:yes gene_type:complete